MFITQPLFGGAAQFKPGYNQQEVQDRLQALSQRDVQIEATPTGSMVRAGEDTLEFVSSTTRVRELFKELASGAAPTFISRSGNPFGLLTGDDAEQFRVVKRDSRFADSPYYYHPASEIDPAIYYDRLVPTKEGNRERIHEQDAMALASGKSEFLEGLSAALFQT